MFLEKFSRQAKNIKISVDSKTLALQNYFEASHLNGIGEV